jgi:hypothetical protein
VLGTAQYLGTLFPCSRFVFCIYFIHLEKKRFTQFLFDGLNVKYVHTNHPEWDCQGMPGYYLKLRHNFLPNNISPTHHSPNFAVSSSTV